MVESHLDVGGAVTFWSLADWSDRARLQAEFGTSQQRNDLWVAACSLAQPDPFPIVTNDGDFDRIAEKFPQIVVVRPDI